MRGREADWSLDFKTELVASYTLLNFLFSHVDLKSFNVFSNDLILTAIVFKQPGSCWVTKLPAPFNLSAVTAARCHPNTEQTSPIIWLPLSEVFSTVSRIQPSFVPHHYIGCIDLGTFLSPVKALNAGVSWSEWWRGWDVLFPYLRLGHYVRLGGQDRSRAGESSA